MTHLTVPAADIAVGDRITRTYDRVVVTSVEVYANPHDPTIAMVRVEGETEQYRIPRMFTYGAETGVAVAR